MMSPQPLPGSKGPKMSDLRCFFFFSGFWGVRGFRAFQAFRVFRFFGFRVVAGTYGSKWPQRLLK